MEIVKKVTLFLATDLFLVGSFLGSVQAATAMQNLTGSGQTVSVNQVSVDKKHEDKFGFTAYVSRNTSLYDFQDGSRKDSIDYLAIPSYSISSGTISSWISYSQDLRDKSPEGSDWSDIPFIFSFKVNKWQWSPPYVLTLTPTVTIVLPVSKISVKKDQLQTAVSTGINFGIISDRTARAGTWNLGLGLTLGRAFHPYEEDINGNVLNRYSSNQSLTLGYTYSRLSATVKYIHKTRLTYQGNTKDSFELLQMIDYALNDNYSLGVGHSNAGSGLKANATESNFKVVNENDSVVYVQLAVSY